ncbi:MAG: hypothetical protein LBD16_05945, partial [Oscillospiraceae bacterium]|nr:hypothetical protein [Oscillospiraceae bacterium]
MVNISTWKELYDAFVIQNTLDSEYNLVDNIDIKTDDPTTWPWVSKDLLGTAAARIKINGNGHRIGSKKKPLTEPLFINLGYADIDNLQVFTAINDDIGIYSVAGAIAGHAANCSFSKITVSGRISAAEADYCGGVAGEAVSCEFISCANNADLTNNHADAYAAGIAGAATTGALYSCKNTGDIEGTNAGGITGLTVSSRVISCQNSGLLNESAAFTSTLAGISAIVQESSEILDNINSGYIGTDKSTAVYLSGGIIGSISSAAAGTFITVSNNVNICTVFGYSAGGIIGYVDSEVYGTINITQNDDLGDVTAIAIAGGIIGGEYSRPANSYVANNRVCANKIETTDTTGGNMGGLIGTISTSVTYPKEVSNNYVRIKNLLGSTSITHWMIGLNGGAEDIFSDNYYDDADSTTTPSPIDCTASELCGDPIDPDAHTLPVGDSLSNCMRAVWDETDCGTTGQSSAS